GVRPVAHVRAHDAAGAVARRRLAVVAGAWLADVGHVLVGQAVAVVVEPVALLDRHRAVRAADVGGGGALPRAVRAGDVDAARALRAHRGRADPADLDRRRRDDVLVDLAVAVVVNAVARLLGLDEDAGVLALVVLGHVEIPPADLAALEHAGARD